MKTAKKISPGVNPQRYDGQK